MASLRLGWPTVFVQALIVAGVAAGISATFLAQLSAVFFALEVVLGGFGGLVFIVPTLLAVATSAVTTFRLTGTPPVYAIPLDAVHWDAEPAPVPAAGRGRRGRRHRIRAPVPSAEGRLGRGRAAGCGADGHRRRDRRCGRGGAARCHRVRHGDHEGALRGCDHPVGHPAGARAGQAPADARQPRSRGSWVASSDQPCSSARRSERPWARSWCRCSPASGLSPVIFAMVGTVDDAQRVSARTSVRRSRRLRDGRCLRDARALDDGGCDRPRAFGALPDRVCIHVRLREAGYRSPAGTISGDPARATRVRTILDPISRSRWSDRCAPVAAVTADGSTGHVHGIYENGSPAFVFGACRRR